VTNASEMTYIVSGEALNSTHSLAVAKTQNITEKYKRAYNIKRLKRGRKN